MVFVESIPVVNLIAAGSLIGMFSKFCYEYITSDSTKIVV